MVVLLRMVGVLLLGCAAMGALAWGWGWWLGWAINVGEEHGPTWQWVVVGTTAVFNVLVAAWLFRLQDRLARQMDYRMGRSAPRDRLFCQRYDTPASADQVLCAVCRGTRFVFSRSAAQRPLNASG